MATRVEKYLAHLDRIFAGAEPSFHPIPSGPAGRPWVVTAIVYRDVPEPGFITGLTYGLSLADHTEWRLGKPELTITVKSTDIDWAIVPAVFADEWRGRQPFIYGSTMNHGEPICAETKMSAFVIFAPAILEPIDCEVDVGEAKKVILNGCYPIHESERKFIQAHGLEAFWKLDWDPFDVQRPAAV